MPKKIYTILTLEHAIYEHGGCPLAATCLHHLVNI